MSDATEAMKYAEQVREICLRYYMPPKTLPNGERNLDDHPALRADALLAANCMVSLARIFKALQTPSLDLFYMALADISWGLLENRFWTEHNATLVPAYKSAFFALMSAKTLRADQDKSELKEALRTRLEKQWHSLFIIAMDKVLGPFKTIDLSTAMLQELETIL